MERYILLYMMLGILLLARVFATQIQGGLRFSGNKKLNVKENSIFRKLLLRKKDHDYPLKTYKILPWVINLVLFCIVLLVYISYAILYTSPIGLAIGCFLESKFVLLFCTIWFLLVTLYIGIINAL